MQSAPVEQNKPPHRRFEPSAAQSINLALDLKDQVIRAQKVKKFRQLIVEKIKAVKIRGNTAKDQKKAQRKASRWFTAAFYDNVAAGNIVNFEIKAFESSIISSAEVSLFLKEADNFVKRQSGDSSVETDTIVRPPPLDVGRVRSSSNSDRSPRSTTSSPRVNSGSPQIDILEEISASSKSPPKLNFLQRRFSGELIRIRNFSGEKLLEYGRTSFRMSNHIEQMLREKYVGPINQISEYLFIVGLRYSILEINNHHLSIPKSVVELFQFELFGSPFNTIRPYFSPFPEIETVFGSKGSFFVTPLPGEYLSFTFNPPYDEVFMERAVIRLIDQMKKHPCFVLCVLPLWDPHSRKEAGAPICTRELVGTNDPNKARKFDAYDRLVESGLIVEQTIRKRDFDAPVFTDYVAQKNNLVLCDIHLILLASCSFRIPLAKIIEAWK